MQPDIHPSAIINDPASIDDDVVIGPYCIVGKNVKIKKGTRLHSNIIIDDNTEIGENCTIYPFTSIGLPPQDMKYDGRETGVIIGKENTIREYITIHRASVSGDGYTRIGDNNYLMAYVHIAHDCYLGNHITMANVATLAGHVIVGDHTVIGGLAAVHQFTRIGAYAMIGGFSGVAQDVPPYTTASGPRARLYGLNTIGLKRYGFPDDVIMNLKRAYKIIFRSKLTLKEAIKTVEEDFPDIEEIKKLIRFIEENKRGICRKT